MSRRKLIATLSSIALGAVAAHAQYPQDAVGFAWTNVGGSTAGRFCWGFDCRPASIRVSAGDQVELLVRSDGQNQPYVVFASLGASQCLSIPGVAHQLVLDFPIYVAVSGTLSQGSPILSCPSFYDVYAFTFPSGLPIGSSFAVQALTFTAVPQPALSIAIVATVA